MEVTRANFVQVLPEIKEAINNALFLSIDGEFTGLRTGADTMAIDTPAEYYNKLRTGSLDFLLIQFGLAIFNFCPKTDKYSYQAYSFYLFPSSSTIGQALQDTWFKSQASSIDMLAQGKFDFNKVFHDGIPFLNQQQQGIVLGMLDDKRRLRTMESVSVAQNRLPIPLEHRDNIERICSMVENFINGSSQSNLTLPPCNAFVRKLIYETLKARFGHDAIRIQTENLRIVVKKRLSIEERLQEEIERLEQENVELDRAIGFTHLIDAISKSKKLLVGHNMMLDLCHIIKRFWKPLPEEYEEFKALVHQVFPRIMDTKHLCRSPLFSGKLPSTALINLYNNLRHAPFRMIEATAPLDRGFHSNEWRQHNAGFDAFITGIIYQTLANYIGSLESPPLSPMYPDHPALSSMSNIIHLMRLESYMNLDGREPVQDRSHVFYVTFPRQWRNGNINRLFNPYGGVYIRWLSDVSVIVTLQEKYQATKVMEELVERRRGGVYSQSQYKVIPYDEFIAEGGLKEVQRPSYSRRRVINPNKQEIHRKSKYFIFYI